MPGGSKTEQLKNFGGNETIYCGLTKIKKAFTLPSSAICSCGIIRCFTN